MGTRIATVADAPEAAALLDRFQREYAAFTPGPAVLAERVRAHLASEASAFLLAESPGVGVAQLRFREYLITGTVICTVEELYVVPDRRGEGHGRALMEDAIALARTRGASDIDLNTSESDTAARRLYERLGFTNLEVAGRPETRMLYYERAL